MFYAAVWICHTRFPNICERVIFSHFDGSFFLGKKEISCGGVVVKVNKTSLCSGVFLCQFRAKHTHTLNHAPTKLRLCNMSTHFWFLSGDADV